LLTLLAVLGIGVAVAEAAGFDIVGHRGTRGYRPENTIPAFQEALKLGATKVEADLVATKDDRVVVSHDPRVSRDLCKGPYVGRRFKTLTLEQVRRMDCGTRRVNDQFKKTQLAVPGAHIPELGQILRVVRPTPERLLVEMKLDPTNKRDFIPQKRFVRLVARTIRKQQMTGRVTVQSFNWGALRALARVQPKLRLVGLANSVTVYPNSPWLGGVKISPKPFTAGLSAAGFRAGFDGIAAAAPLISPTIIEGAHARGMRVFAYTVDDPAKMADLIGMDVDGIVTDFPDRLREEATKSGVRIAR
jgi:glycerophosphoryl diester phosphodiesterase